MTILADPTEHPVIGHRGMAAAAPENTLDAMQLAFSYGADAVEFDLRLSADGEVVVIHDPTVDRTTDGTGLVAGKTLAELRELNAAARFVPGSVEDRLPPPTRAKDGNVYPEYSGIEAPSQRRSSIPLFTEVLEQFGDRNLLIEIKDERASAPARRLIEKFGLEKRCLVDSYSDAALAGFRGSRIPVGAGKQGVITLLKSFLSFRFIVKADRNAQSAQLITLEKRDGTWIRSHRLIELDATIPADPTAQALVERWQDSLVKRLGPAQIIATTPTPIDVSNTPLRSRETPYGNLATDAMRAGTGAQVAGMIGGSMRYDDEIPAGPISNLQIESIYLFPDETRIATFPITGARLREILEHSISRGGAQFAGYLQLSGVRFQWDSTRAAGSRIVGDLLRDDGSVIAPAETVKFSINAYTACEGGDGYSIPESAEACKARESGPRAAQLIIDYLRAMKTVTLPAIGRVTGIR